MSIEAMKHMVEAIEADLKLFNIPTTARMLEALNAGRQAIAEAEKQEQPLPPIEIGVDVTVDGAWVVALYRRPDGVMEMFYSQFHPQPAQPKSEWVGEEWKPCVKLPIVVHVREQRKGETHVSTREGITPVKEDDLIMRGVAGEEYPIGRELFNRTYTFDTAPPKREWVGLTDEEINEAQDTSAVEFRKNKYQIRGQMVMPGDSPDWWFARVIERFLKEKNT